MNKPRITLVEPGVWECACGLVSQRGTTANQAYDLWLHASLVDAMTKKPAPAAKPRANGRPITIKPVPKPLPVVKKQPKYHPSVVHVVPGTASVREYRPPAGLMANLSRAALSEPKLSPMVSNLRFERRVDL